MVRLEFTITIDRPPSDVFAYLTDPERLPEWQSSALEAKADGPVGVGTRITDVRKFLGRRIESTVEVTQYEPDSRFSLKTLTGPIPFEAHHTLRPDGGGTRLTFVGEGEPGGFFKLAGPLVSRQAERQFKGDFETLKDLLEAEPRG